jgi:hypothetical protein
MTIPHRPPIFNVSMMCCVTSKVATSVANCDSGEIDPSKHSLNDYSVAVPQGQKETEAVDATTLEKSHVLRWLRQRFEQWTGRLQETLGISLVSCGGEAGIRIL